MKLIKKLYKKNKTELLLILLGFIFSWWLMFSTFSYSNGEMLISSKAWSDFANHIPLIRSFSFGFNFPVEFPLFPGEPIRYHFLFYLFVGMLEKIGLRIDYALNLPSILGFVFLIFMIYLFAKNVFNSKGVGILSAVFFLFNGSLSFWLFLKEKIPTDNIFINIVTNDKFPSFGPYDTGIVSAFWNLNIYTNQRHLALSFALSLLAILILLNPVLKNKKNKIKISALIGIVMGSLFLLNMAVFLMTVILLVVLATLFSKTRFSIFITLSFAFLFSFPQYLYFQSGVSTFKPFLNLGYLISGDLSFFNFINYWFYNLGLHLFLIPVTFIISNLKQKKIFLSFLMLFIIANTFQFSREMAANHKFFNYFMIVGVMFSAYFIVKVSKKFKMFRPILPVLVFLLIFSGIVDFFPIYNDSKISLADYPKREEIRWIMENTPKDAVFLNSDYLYNPASLAGRKIFLGWPYFAWSQGYDTEKRDLVRKNLLKTNDWKYFCDSTIENKINYAIIENEKQSMSENFEIVYENEIYKIYNLKGRCLKKY